MAEYTSLEVPMWINKLNLNFKDALIPLGLSCISFFYHIKVNEPLLRATTKFWIPTWHVFQFNGVELCHTPEEFCAIMGKYDLGAIVLPTIKEHLSDLTYQLLGVHLAIANRWCKSNKLNVSMVFKYFSKKDVPLAGVKRSHHLNAFFLCILARFVLVHETPRVDPWILHVVRNLGSGSLIAIILAKTLNDLDAIHKEEATLFAGCPFLLQVWSLIFV